MSIKNNAVRTRYTAVHIKNMFLERCPETIAPHNLVNGDIYILYITLGYTELKNKTKRKHHHVFESN
jgi:hypothetical protein